MNKEDKILYVDDEKINLLVLKKILGKKYTILTALSGMEGLEILDQDPDIKYVITDMSMPIMTGIEFIKEARKNHSDKKYYILTGYSINSEIEEALRNKLILKYFMKPAEFDELEKAFALPLQTTN